MSRKFRTVSVIAFAVLISAFTGTALATNPHNPSGSAPGNSAQAQGHQAQAPAQAENKDRGNGKSEGKQDEAQSAPAAEPAKAQEQQSGSKKEHSKSEAKGHSRADAKVQPKSEVEAEHAVSKSKKTKKGHAATTESLKERGANPKSEADVVGNPHAHPTVCHKTGNGWILIAPSGRSTHVMTRKHPDKIVSLTREARHTMTPAEAGCGEEKAPITTPTAPQQVLPVCGRAVVTTTNAERSTVKFVGRGHTRMKVVNPKSNGKAKNRKTIVTTTTTQTLVATGENCGEQNANTSHTIASQSQATTQTNAVVAQSQPGAAAQLSQNSQTPSSKTAAAGGVAGVTASKGSKPAGGVLGAVGSKLGKTAVKGSLPFTGFPIWVAALVGAALVAGGLVLRRRTASDL